MLYLSKIAQYLLCSVYSHTFWSSSHCSLSSSVVKFISSFPSPSPTGLGVIPKLLRSAAQALYLWEGVGRGVSSPLLQGGDTISTQGDNQTTTVFCKPLWCQVPATLCGLSFYVIPAGPRRGHHTFYGHHVIVMWLSCGCHEPFTDL